MDLFAKTIIVPPKIILNIRWTGDLLLYTVTQIHRFHHFLNSPVNSILYSRLTALTEGLTAVLELFIFCWPGEKFLSWNPFCIQQLMPETNITHMTHHLSTAWNNGEENFGPISLIGWTNLILVRQSVQTNHDYKITSKNHYRSKDVYFMNKLHKCLIKNSFIQTLHLHVFFCLCISSTVCPSMITSWQFTI